MPPLNTLNIPSPKNPDEFESLCLELWKRRWEDPHAQKNGRKGQSQKGVDVFGRSLGSAEYEGVQSKAVSQPLTEVAIDKEVEQAKTLESLHNRVFEFKTGKLLL